MRLIYGIQYAYAGGLVHRQGSSGGISLLGGIMLISGS